MHMQPVFEMTPGARGIAHSDGKRYKARVVGGEVSEDLFERGLCLPSGTGPPPCSKTRHHRLGTGKWPQCVNLGREIQTGCLVRGSLVAMAGFEDYSHDDLEDSETGRHQSAGAGHHGRIYGE